MRIIKLITLYTMLHGFVETVMTLTSPLASSTHGHCPPPSELVNFNNQAMEFTILKSIVKLFHFFQQTNSIINCVFILHSVNLIHNNK